MKQPRLIDVPMMGVYPMDVGEANALIAAWGHSLGFSTFIELSNLPAASLGGG